MAEAHGDHQPQNANARRQARFAAHKRAAGYTPHTFWLARNELAAVRQLLNDTRGPKT